MKANDIKKCCACGQGLMHSGLPLFWRVKLQRMGIDRKAVEQTAGLEMMLGSAALARVMGPDPDIAKPVDSECVVVICEPCAGAQVSIYEIALSEAGQAA